MNEMAELLRCMGNDMETVFSWFPYALLLGLEYAVLRTMHLRMRKESTCRAECVDFWKKTVVQAVFVVYLGMLLETVFFCREPGSRIGMQMHFLETWGVTMQDHAWVLENVILFLPFGFLLPLCICRRFRWAVVPVGCLCSVGIEWIQLRTGRGFCQLDDVVMNTLGAAIGYVLFLAGNQLRQKQVRRLCFGAAAAGWMLVIFLFSAQPAEKSTETSLYVGRMICSVVVADYEQLSLEEQSRLAERIEFPVRKGAHMTEYAILAVLLLGTVAERPVRRKDVLRAVALAAAYAATDEFHQRFVAGRSGQARDVLIDSLGAFCGAEIAARLEHVAGRRRIRGGGSLDEK